MPDKNSGASTTAPVESDPFALALDLAGQLLKQLTEMAKNPSEEEANRLLGKNDGLIDGFNSLSAALARVLDRAPDPNSNMGGAIPDDQEIHQRIAAELDRIAARARAHGNDSENCTDAGGTPATILHVGALESPLGPGAAG